MLHFREFSALFSEKFNKDILPPREGALYSAGNYFLQLGGKRIRPVLCLMGNEMFDEINKDTWEVAYAIELFHNFTLIHDDIMDKATLRRGKPTVHEKFGESTALLSGDVLLVLAYEHLNNIRHDHLHRIIQLFNRTARQVCEGQQLDMEYEKMDEVNMEDYLHMIELKTSVLLAASLQMGAILGGAGLGNQQHLYAFGLALGMAFQIQDDYLDAFGDPDKFGKEQGGDIRTNKKTFLLIRALETCTAAQRTTLQKLMHENPADKVQQVLRIFRECGVDQWAHELKEEYFRKAEQQLDDIAVLSRRKEPLLELANFLLKRDH